jgi:hypothetical protein
MFGVQPSEQDANAQERFSYGVDSDSPPNFAANIKSLGNNPVGIAVGDTLAAVSRFAQGIVQGGIAMLQAEAGKNQPMIDKAKETEDLNRHIQQNRIWAVASETHRVPEGIPLA